eukprot:gene6844-8488_t
MESPTIIDDDRLVENKPKIEPSTTTIPSTTTLTDTTTTTTTVPPPIQNVTGSNNKKPKAQQQQQNKKTEGANSLSKNKNNDSFKRINFLYQASHLLLMNSNNQNLSGFYCDSLKQIAQKSVIRLNPSIKRNLCKKCSSLLLPGLSSTVRLQGIYSTN